jgi:hypothetical protein
MNNGIALADEILQPNAVIEQPKLKGNKLETTRIQHQRVAEVRPNKSFLPRDADFKHVQKNPTFFTTKDTQRPP